MSDVAPSVESSSRARARRLLLAAALVSGLIFAAGLAFNLWFVPLAHPVE